MELQERISRYRPFRAQQNSQQTTVLPVQAQEIPRNDDPPNGGLKAWLQVLGGFLIIFNAQ